jgi:hypothetical protein
MTQQALLAELAGLERAVTGLEQALDHAVARVKGRSKRSANQMDLFAMSMVAVNDAGPANIDTDEMARRIARAIEQIEHVLHHHAA